MSFHAYMLECADGSFYVGHTDNIDARFSQHAAGEGAAWTKNRLPVKLAWSESFGTRDEAFTAERKVKGWSRAKKKALIEQDWSTVEMLSRRKQNGHSTPPPALRDAVHGTAPQDERHQREPA